MSSTLSPKTTSSCVLSPYNFDLDSPPPTAEDFNEFFNAPATYMEKDFSQLTLSGTHTDTQTLVEKDFSQLTLSGTHRHGHTDTDTQTDRQTDRHTDTEME